MMSQFIFHHIINLQYHQFDIYLWYHRYYDIIHVTSYVRYWTWMSFVMSLWVVQATNIQSSRCNASPSAAMEKAAETGITTTIYVNVCWSLQAVCSLAVTEAVISFLAHMSIRQTSFPCFWTKHAFWASRAGCKFYAEWNLNYVPILSWKIDTPSIIYDICRAEWQSLTLVTCDISLHFNPLKAAMCSPLHLSIQYCQLRML